MVFFRPESNKVDRRIEQSPDRSPVASKPLSYGSSPGRLTPRNTLSVTLVSSYVELYLDENSQPGNVTSKKVRILFSVYKLINVSGSKMCILYTHHGGILGDRGCGAGCHCSSSVGSVSLIWCPWIQTSLYSLLQGHKRTLLGRLDCCSRCGTMEFTQTDRSSNSLVGGSSASTVG